MLTRIILTVLLFLNIGLAIEYDGLWFIGFNLSRPVWQGKAGEQLRKAIAQSADRASLAIAGGAPLALAAVYPTAEFTPTQDTYAQGFQKPQSTSLSITVLHSNGIKTQQIAEIFQENLKRLNIEPTFKAVTFDRSWADTLKKGDYDIFMMGFKADYQGPVETFLRPLFGRGGYANFMHYSSPTINTLLLEIKTARPVRRSAIIKEINRVVCADMPIIPIFYIEQIAGGI